jgi:membrane protease YdiL (CAAX protease family)
VSINAAAGEEAFFRGYLLPMMYQRTGQKFWLANGTQAAVFGVLHGRGAVIIAPWAYWEGWLTRHNDWSVRESIFHHFWYDVAVISAELIVDDNAPRRVRRVGISVPF